MESTLPVSTMPKTNEFKPTGPKSNVQVSTHIIPKSNVSKSIIPTPTVTNSTVPVKKSFLESMTNFIVKPFVKTLTKSNVPVNVNQSFVEVLNKPEPITVLGFQTGMGRNNEVIPKTNQSIICNITLNKKKLSHFEEATNEMQDFKRKFGDFFYDVDIYQDFQVFLSIGSTSIQGWIKTNRSKGYNVIIPPNESNIEFQQIGTTRSSSEVNHKKLREILNKFADKKVLCFNMIGYDVLNGNVPVPIEEHQGITQLSKQKNSSSKIKNNPNPYNHIVLDLLACNTSKNIFIFPKNGIINGKQLDASWASELAKQNRNCVVDIGGDEVYLYDSLGNKDEQSLYEKGKGPNNFYETHGGFTTEVDKLLMNDIVNRLLQKKEVSKGGYIKKRRKTKKQKKYKRKSKKV